MIGRRIAQFEVVGMVGRGGMGTVFEAVDTGLGRRVALKVLGRDLVDQPEARDRLAREARAAAALDHPNICPVFQVGETPEGQLFVAMPLYRGETLRDRLLRGPLDCDEACAIVGQLVDGLAYGHDHGIVHRDVKPANVFIVRGGSVRILDFGIAKVRDAETLTLTGAVMGTPGYMAPEQVLGKPADEPADVWAIGVLLYEMLTGRNPFRRDTAHATMWSIVNEEPPPIEQRISPCPGSVAAFVRGALKKDPQKRPPTMGRVQQILGQEGADAEAPTTTLSAPPFTPRPTPGHGETEGSPSVAVLPFTDLSPGGDQGYFCEGICEELINDLARVEGLSVPSRTSSFRYRSADLDAPQIARELGVRHLLEGSVRKAGPALRVSVQLVDAVADRQLWSQRFDGGLDDIFALQEAIAREIVRALKVELSPPESSGLRRHPARRADAYDRYLAGRQAFHRGGQQHIQRAIDLFHAAIDFDPAYALAHSGLADAYAWRFLYWQRTPEDLDRCSRASARAVELDPELAEAHTSRGIALWISHRYDDAWAEFEEATSLSPRLFEAWYLWGYAAFVVDLGRSAELLEKACRLRPEDYQCWNVLAKAKRGLGHEEEALAAHRHALELVEHRRRLGSEDQRPLVVGADALVSLGDRERALEWIDAAEALDPEDPMLFYSACALARAGETERAIASLSAIVTTGFSHREWAEADPDLESLRHDPRFAAILDRMA